MRKKYFKRLVYMVNDTQIEFDQFLLKTEIEKIILRKRKVKVKTFDDVNPKSFKSDIDTVFEEIDYVVENLQTVNKLLDKYQTRANLTNQEIEHITGIADYSNFKKNKNFNKEKLCMLTICMHLTYKEAKQVLLAASIKLNPKRNIFDYVYSLYIKNYMKTNSEQDVKDFIERLDEVQEMLDERLR